MKRAARRGFTLVELLVVITIISMLMALLLPAVQAARETARRATCSNNQKQLTLALQGYEASQEKFPGYQNFIDNESVTGSGNPVFGSWLVMILPYLEQNELYDAWRDPLVYNATASVPKPVIDWELLNCPSNPPDPPADPNRVPFAYAINCGVRNGTYSFTGPSGTYVLGGRERAAGVIYRGGAACGISHLQDRRETSLGGLGKNGSTTVGLSYISQHDGSVYTLLISENKSNKSWTYPLEVIVPASGPVQAGLGILWDPTWEPDLGTLPWPPGINYDEDEDLPRPSSDHPGGVMGSFVDGHQSFIKDTIDYLVYQRIMAPSDRVAGTLAQMTGWDYRTSGTVPTQTNLIIEPTGDPAIFDPGDL